MYTFQVFVTKLGRSFSWYFAPIRENLPWCRGEGRDVTVQVIDPWATVTAEKVPTIVTNRTPIFVGIAITVGTGRHVFSIFMGFTA